MAGIPEDEWCTCEGRVTINGKAYPKAARIEIPGLSWLTGLVGGGGNKKAPAAKDGGAKDKEEL